MSEKRCYTVQELQEILGVSRSTIYNLLNADKHSPASSAQSTKRRITEINKEKELDMRRKQKIIFVPGEKEFVLPHFF